LLAVEAKKRQGERTDLKPNIPVNSQESPKARESGVQAGKSVGVGGQAVQRAKQVTGKAPDLVPKIKAGK
jgi:hypothetical protein